MTTKAFCSGETRLSPGQPSPDRWRTRGDGREKKKNCFYIEYGGKVPAYDGLADDGQVQEQLLHILLERVDQRFPIDDQGERIRLRRPAGLLILDGAEFLIQVLSGGLGGFFVDDQKGHILTDEFAAHADVDGRLLSISGQDPDLDAGRLKGVDGVGHTILQSILDGRRTQKGEVMLDDLRGLLELVRSVPTDGGGGGLVDLDPVPVLLLGHLSHRQT